MGNLGPLEITGIVVLFILLFGAKKLPDLGSSVGKSIRNFKKGINEADQGDDAASEARKDPAQLPSGGAHDEARGAGRGAGADSSSQAPRDR